MPHNGLAVARLRHWHVMRRGLDVQLVPQRVLPVAFKVAARLVSPRPLVATLVGGLVLLNLAGRDPDEYHVADALLLLIVADAGGLVTRAAWRLLSGRKARRRRVMEMIADNRRRLDAYDQAFTVLGRPDGDVADGTRPHLRVVRGGNEDRTAGLPASRPDEGPRGLRARRRSSRA
jgi:hypothetical protein